MKTLIEIVLPAFGAIAGGFVTVDMAMGAEFSVYYRIIATFSVCSLSLSWLANALDAFGHRLDPDHRTTSLRGNPCSCGRRSHR